MPAQLTYPGVYIEEIPSGVRTIMGVSTSTTAFLGRASCGPVNEPKIINNFGDFERTFGKIQENLPLGYSVKDFFSNGGGKAIVVRLYKKAASAQGTLEGLAELDVGGVMLQASSQGIWANNLKAIVDYIGIDDNPKVPERFGLDTDQMFNLTIFEEINGKSTKVEKFLNVAVDKLQKNAGSRRVDRVLAAESSMVKVKLVNNKPGLPSTRPPIGPAPAPAGAPAPAPAAAPAPKEKLFGPFTGGNDGQGLSSKEDFIGGKDPQTGLYALDKADIFNLLCIPPDGRETDVPAEVFQAAAEYCHKRRAFLIVDPQKSWGKLREKAVESSKNGVNGMNLGGEYGINAAIFFPCVLQTDSLRGDQIDTFVPCGIIAGIMARTDTQRGVWKAPAGIDASINGISGLQVDLNDDENGDLNPFGINCLRNFDVYGKVVWGARTLRGADQLASEWKYIPIRRLALYIEESLYRGTKWVVFEPNDEPLWAQIRLNIGAFMHSLFRQGAFQGTTPKDAYFVKCDKETTTQDDRNRGIVNIVVGFAPLKPAEFVVIKIQQMAGQIET